MRFLGPGSKGHREGLDTTWHYCHPNNFSENVDDKCALGVSFGACVVEGLQGLEVNLLGTAAFW